VLSTRYSTGNLAAVFRRNDGVVDCLRADRSFRNRLGGAVGCDLFHLLIGLILWRNGWLIRNTTGLLYYGFGIPNNLLLR
jgi:hypothetical protein